MGRPLRLEKQGKNLRLREVWGLLGFGRKPMPPVGKRGLRELKTSGWTSPFFLWPQERVSLLLPWSPACSFLPRMSCGWVIAGWEISVVTEERRRAMDDVSPVRAVS